MPARDAHTAAGLLAGCAEVAAEDDWLSEGRRRELVASCGDRAVAALCQAIDKDAKDVTPMKTDPGLDPLRPRSDFQKLLTGVKAETPKSGAAPKQM